MVAPAATDDAEEDEESMDWWTKYFASIDTMIEVSSSMRGWQFPRQSFPLLERSRCCKCSLKTRQIMPIVHVSQPWGTSCSSISDDLALLTPIHPEALASASKSLLDVSNLGKMSALSVSSPALAADLGGGFLWKRLAKSGKTKQATSKTRLLEPHGPGSSVQGSVDTLTTQVSWSPTTSDSWPVSSGFGAVGGGSCSLGPVHECVSLSFLV